MKEQGGEARRSTPDMQRLNWFAALNTFSIMNWFAALNTFSIMNWFAAVNSSSGFNELVCWFLRFSRDSYTWWLLLLSMSDEV